MNIILIRRNFTTIAPGGAERAASEIAFGLINRGHSVTVLSEKFTIKKNEENINLKWIKVPKKRSLLGGTYAFHKQSQKILNKYNLRDNYDIVFSLCRTYPVDVMRVTEQIHHIWLPMNYSLLQRLNPRHWSLLKLEKKLFLQNQAKHFVVISKLFKKQLIEKFSVDERKISVVYNGLDHSNFYSLKNNKEKLEKLKNKHKIKNDHITFLFVAHNFKIKGLYTIIEALKLLPKDLQKKFTLLIVGDDNKEIFLKKINELNLTQCDIRFLGKQSNMPELYQVSDILVYPGSFETFGNVCTEAMACGVPVISSPLVGASEIINHKLNGYTLDNFNNSEQLTTFLTEYMNQSNADKIKMSNKAIETAKDFDWNKNVQYIEKLFTEIANSKN